MPLHLKRRLWGQIGYGSSAMCGHIRDDSRWDIVGTVSNGGLLAPQTVCDVTNGRLVCDVCAVNKVLCRQITGAE
jgi:hypothetical protein